MQRRIDKKPDFIRAKKSLGQNFCCDHRIPDEIIATLQASSSNQIWEIGPGKGALTERLVETGADIHLFEIDQRLKNVLEQNFPDIQITWGDFLELTAEALPEIKKPLLVCGNLPYYCGTPIIKRFLEAGPHAERLVFLLQQEVAEKAAAEANSKDYGYLSVHTAFFAKARTGDTYPPSSFVPRPKINSTILVIEPLSLTEQEKARRIQALKTVSRLFTQRRKMALPQLKKINTTIDWSARFEELQISATARPENISPQQFLQLFG